MARNRYQQSFNSTIFEAPPNQGGQPFIPAGKRRDQTTSELFGSYHDKELKASPKTFAPKDDGVTARQKKLAFLSSNVLPHTAYPPCGTSPRLSQSPKGYAYCDEEDDEERPDPVMRKQEELSSALFGRESPAVVAEDAREARRKLTPNDFKWFNIPEPLTGPGEQDDVTHADRSYREKCSSLFSHQSPQVRDEVEDAQRASRMEESVGDAKRRNNVYYSDLFGRPAHEAEDPPMPSEGTSRRAKAQCAAEDRITIHQDWTDSKTELVMRPSPKNRANAGMRKNDELHRMRIFGRDDEYDNAMRPDPVNHDNSGKLKSAFGLPTQQIHQAHLRTSMTPDEFYQEAASTKDWEVVELFISGLGLHTDDNVVKNMCRGSDVQIVKVSTEVDPVRNLCKGRAKVVVRYNPTRDSLAQLVNKLESSSLRVEV